MGNTLTIDGTLFAELQARAASEQLPVEQLAEKLIRAGIESSASKAPWRQPTRPMGGIDDWSRIKQLDAEEEVERFLRISKPNQ